MRLDKKTTKRNEIIICYVIGVAIIIGIWIWGASLVQTTTGPCYLANGTPTTCTPCVLKNGPAGFGCYPPSLEDNPMLALCEQLFLWLTVATLIVLWRGNRVVQGGKEDLGSTVPTCRVCGKHMTFMGNEDGGPRWYCYKDDVVNIA